MSLNLCDDLDMYKTLCFNDRNFHLKKLCRLTTFPFSSQENGFLENLPQLADGKKNFKQNITKFALREKCPNTEISLVRIFLYAVQIQENAERKKLRAWTLFTKCEQLRIMRDFKMNVI